MGEIVLKPWPFEDREVQLYWFGDVFRNVDNTWRINIAFLDRGEIEVVNYPIGVLPILELGQFYHQGKILYSQARGIADQVTIADTSQGWSISAIELKDKFFSEGVLKESLTQQKIWAFKVEDVIYYVPHVEIIRVFFAMNKILAQRMMEPKGLEFLIEDYSEVGSQAHIHLSSEIPTRLVTKRFIQYCAWLYGDSNIRVSFESVYTNMYEKMLRAGNKEVHIPLEVELPSLRELTWEYRGIKKGNEVLVLQIEAISGIGTRITQCFGSHPKVKKQEDNSQSTKSKRKKGKEIEHTLIDNENQRPRVNSNQRSVRRKPIKIGFITKVKVALKQETEGKGGRKSVLGGESSEKATKPISLEESLYGGASETIEFNSVAYWFYSTFDLLSFKDLI